jgi:hypothetical protein
MIYNSHRKLLFDLVNNKIKNEVKLYAIFISNDGKFESGCTGEFVCFNTSAKDYLIKNYNLEIKNTSKLMISVINSIDICYQPELLISVIKEKISKLKTFE